ncbi:hypothetical protein P154DRAFT_522846 [Amniculicola lignicola CBS 123094]|uniref:BZIP domain-containing protein n=1 Tax=Amniculicola lignicola CBS 123094 TaxID=1392246 RepID=A0A6A5WF35_9PLEO|nr:hypothetical protein P154DRAFT_522846 [Amniculicola lignicola CBS 123094]
MGSEHLYNTHFAQTLTTPAIISHHQMTPPPMDHHSRSQGTINMQELSCMAGGPPTSHPSHPSHPSTPSSHSHSPDGKTKKRKSWGQVLPEPKTNLPPRKRAKTEDEKEQRRIERVKRNRLAAHNSRERKRQEVEALQVEKDKVHDKLHAVERRMAAMAAELKAFRAKYPNEVVPQVDLDTAPSSIEEYDTINPRATSFPSPVSMDDYDSVRDDSCPPETPAYSESATTDFDQTQYPAAMLCDLQCQSISVPASRPSATSSPRASASTSAPRLQATLAYLILFNLSLPMMTSMSSLSSTLTSSPKPRRRPLVTRPTSSTLPSSMMPLTPMAFLRRLVHDTSLCRLTLAQLLLLATSLSQRRSSSKQIVRPVGAKGRIEKDVHIGRRSRHIHRARRSSGTGVKGELRRIVRAFDWEKYQFGAQGRLTGS